MAWNYEIVVFDNNLNLYLKKTYQKKTKRQFFWLNKFHNLIASKCQNFQKYCLWIPKLLQKESFVLKTDSKAH